MSENSNGPDISGTKLVDQKGLVYRLRLPEGKPGRPSPVLVMIHGRGANEGDIYELVPNIDRRVLIAAPRGPLLFDKNPRGNFAWYEFTGSGLSDWKAIEPSLKKLVDFIKDLEETAGVPVDRGQIYFGGFSQGAAMSYALVAAHPDLAAGVIAHSGPFHPIIGEKLSRANLKGKPFFIAHGQNDFLPPRENGRKAAELLKGLGAEVTYKEYPFAHETSPESRQDLDNWLIPRLKFCNYTGS